MKKHLALILVLSFSAAFIACGESPSVSPSNSSTAVGDPNDTPTNAYKRLFAAVKSKNTEAIKAEFSKRTVAQAESEAVRAKVPVDEVYKNGFTGTTFSETLPEIRDERVNGTMGAVEVWNSRESKWEDLPFIREDSGWKLAVGDAFAGSWKRPSVGRAAREREAANAVSGNKSMVNGMANVNVNREMNKKIEEMMRNANVNANNRK
jgi:hypothetical protein